MEKIAARVAQDNGDGSHHGMASSEHFKHLYAEGLRVEFKDDPIAQRACAHSLADILRDDRAAGATVVMHRPAPTRLMPVPKRLMEASEILTFTVQRNKEDAYWGEKYGIRGFKSGATGGDGRIVVYNGDYLSKGLFAHESGHNLATLLWGTTYPNKNSEYGPAQAEEKPVSDYGAHSAAEDFAEACRLYTAERFWFRERFPKKFAALDKILGVEQ